MNELEAYRGMKDSPTYIDDPFDEVNPKNVIASVVQHRFHGQRKYRDRWHWRIEIQQGLSMRGDGADLDGWATKEEAEEAGRTKVADWLRFLDSQAETKGDASGN